jgi:hypothetical protein
MKIGDETKEKERELNVVVVVVVVVVEWEYNLGPSRTPRRRSTSGMAWS